MRRRFGRFYVVAWFLFVGLYLLFSGEVSVSEVAAGAVTASFSIFLVGLLRDKFKQPLLLKRRWFRLLWRIPLAMLTETWLIFKALAYRLLGRESDGVFLHHDFPGPQDEHDPARRAYMTFGVCITPNSYLVYYDQEKRRVLVRQLVGKELSKIDRLFVELP